MFSSRSDGRLQVQIPAPADDRPSWTKVGVIAAIGFLVGIAWPRIAGVRLGPSIPADVASASASAGAPPTASPEPSSPPPSAPAAALAPATPSVAATAQAASVDVAVGHGVVFSCRSSDGDTLKGGDCGTLPGLDGIVMPRLRKLSECADASGASGKLHLVMRLDFGKNALSAELGKGQVVSNPDALLACARGDVSGASLGGVQHDNPRYSVAYTVTFGGGGTASASATGNGAGTPSAATAQDGADGGSAQVVWEVAIVRDAPKTGKVLARLQRGTTVHLGSARDGWYPVKFGDGFGSDGWLYRGAVGR